MGRLIVMIMTGPVGVIVDGIIIVVGNSLKIEFHFTRSRNDCSHNSLKSIFILNT